MLSYFKDILNYPLFSLGGTEITPAALLVALIALITLLLFARRFRAWLLRRLIAHERIDLGTGETVSSLAHYIVLTIGFVTILDGLGVKLSSFTVLAGAFGVGVGFGLQNIFSNFISGLIVMLERPIKIGNHIVIASMEGDVIKIGMRATTIRSAQGNLIVVPNQMIITNIVVNWDQAANSAVALQYRMMGSVQDDEALLLRILKTNPDIIKTPPPSVYVTSVDHAAHIMELHFWLVGDAAHRLDVVSKFNKSLLNELSKLGQNLAPNP